MTDLNTSNTEIIAAPTIEWLSLPKNEIPELVHKYVEYMELTGTRTVCKCKWKSKTPDAQVSLVEQADDCPLHTKEGFLLYFFEWRFAVPEGIRVADSE